MTPNNSPTRDLAFWRLEVNSGMPHLGLGDREAVAVEAWRLHMGYMGLGSPYGIQAAYNNLISVRESQRSHAAAVQSEAEREARRLRDEAELRRYTTERY